MATTFPSLTPSSRSFSPATFPITKTRSQGGVTTRRVWASLPNDARLSLSFNNITDEFAYEILNCYKNAKGSLDKLTLPALIFEGAATDLKIFLQQSNTGLSWHFTDDNPPRVESVLPGVSSVTVDLTATLDRS